MVVRSDIGIFSFFSGAGFLDCFMEDCLEPDCSVQLPPFSARSAELAYPRLGGLTAPKTLEFLVFLRLILIQVYFRAGLA